MKQSDSPLGPASRRRRRRPGENRERLVNAGLVEFANSGYRGASTTAIARAAEVPQPHVYANFQTKEELFLSCVERACKLLGERGSLEGDSDRSEASNAVQQALPQFVLQSVSAAGDVALRPRLLPLLTELRHSIGERSFDALLAQGAVSLMGD